MIGFVSRAKRRGTAPLAGSGAAAGTTASAGPGPIAGSVAGSVAARDASAGKDTPISKDASVGRNPPAGKDAYARASGSTGAVGHAGHASNRSSAGSEPAGRAPGTFIGATLPICGIDVLIVVVHPWVLADIHEANLYVVAFHERFRRRIVLTAQGVEGTPCFYGPTEIIRVLRGLPFEMIPWRRLLFRTAPPPALSLPSPPPRGGSGRTGAAHIDVPLGADSSAVPQREASAALTVGARPANSTDDTTPHRRDSRARRADRTTAH